jgi:hypothetical protein
MKLFSTFILTIRVKAHLHSTWILTGKNPHTLNRFGGDPISPGLNPFDCKLIEVESITTFTKAGMGDQHDFH